MGIVYSAIYPKNGKRVAVKVLSPGMMSDPKLLKRFEREIEILKRLDHPNIVKYYGGGTAGNQRYYAMEYLDGGSLQDILKKRKRLNWEQTIQVGRQITAALEHAHNAGIIHRDLKPANLFLTKKGRLKLGDFGIARDTEATALTAAGKTVGTYAYMAPEQIQVSHPISRKTDLYAVGCLLYEVIVGETPFLSENPMDMLMQHLKDDPYNVSDKVADCPPQLDQLIERLLEKNPDDRPYDALAVHTELGEILDAIKSAEADGLEPGSTGAALPPRTGNKKRPGDEHAVVPAEKPKKKKKKKKKRDDVPIHERTWFLATCLLTLLAATVWLLLPPGEDWYADEWREAIRGDEYAQRATLEDHIDPYLEKFPDGKHVAEAHDLSNLIHANMLELQLKNLGRRSDVIEPPFKAACVRAARLEDEEGLIYKPTWDPPPKDDLRSNPLPALQRWKQLAERGRELMTQSPVSPTSTAAENETGESARPTEADETRWLTRLCDNHHDYFRNKLLSSPRDREFVRDRLVEAEVLAGDDLTLDEARTIWQYIQSEFQKVDRLEDYAEFAQQRLQGNEAELPLAESPAPVVQAGAAGDD